MLQVKGGSFLFSFCFEEIGKAVSEIAFKVFYGTIIRLDPPIYVLLLIIVLLKSTISNLHRYYGNSNLILSQK